MDFDLMMLLPFVIFRLLIIFIIVTIEIKTKQKTKCPERLQHSNKLKCSRLLLLHYRVKHRWQVNPLLCFHVIYSELFSSTYCQFIFQMIVFQPGKCSKALLRYVGEPCGLSGRDGPWNMDEDEIYLILYSLDSSRMRPSLVEIVLQTLLQLDVWLLRSLTALKEEEVCGRWNGGSRW